MAGLRRAGVRLRGHQGEARDRGREGGREGGTEKEQETGTGAGRQGEREGEKDQPVVDAVRCLSSFVPPSLFRSFFLFPLPFQVFLPESDIDMVVLPPQELPVHQVRNNLFQLAEVGGREGARGEGGGEETGVRRDIISPIGRVCLTRKKPLTSQPSLLPSLPPALPPSPLSAPSQAFKQEESVTGMEVIAKARVPIIKLRFHNLQVKQEQRGGREGRGEGGGGGKERGIGLR